MLKTLDCLGLEAKHKPVLVTNPNTGREINIAPLFDLMCQAGNAEIKPKNGESIVRVITSIQRSINIMSAGDFKEESSFDALSNINYNLYCILDCFDRMREL